MDDGRTGFLAKTTGGEEVAKSSVAQVVKVVDQNSPHHDRIGAVIVVAPGRSGSFYWLRFDPIPTGSIQ